MLVFRHLFSRVCICKHTWPITQAHSSIQQPGQKVGRLLSNFSARYLLFTASEQRSLTTGFSLVSLNKSAIWRPELIGTFHICCKHQSENYFDRRKLKNSKSLGSKRENVYTVPNALSIMRIAMAPCIGYYVIGNNFNLALALFVVASFSDLIDGMIARRWPSQRSAIGSALDPLGDKILVASVCISLTYANIIPLFLTALFVGRDVVLATAAFYLRYKTCPPPVTLKRYFDPTLVNVQLAPTFISKVNTMVQMVLLWLSMAAPVFDYVDHTALKILWAVASVTTVSSAFSYASRKDTVQVLDKLKK